MGNFGNRNMGFFSAGSSSGGGGGTVTSVGLSMPSAFTISGTNPITTSGTLAVTGAGLTSQYVRGDGTLANFPTSIGGGASVQYYLNGSINQGTIGGNVYYQMNTTPVLGAGTNFTRTNTQGNGYIAQFITNANDPNQINIPAGVWTTQLYFSANSSGGNPSFYTELYSYNGSTFTLITSGSTTPEIITGGTAIDLYITSLSVPSTSLSLTDRLAVRIYVTTSGRDITLHTEDNNLCQITTTFTTGLTALNGLTAQVQTFATGTSGTDFAINSATSIHTFNLPSASGSNRGALTSADWTTFNGKVSSVSGTSPIVSSGGTTPAISIPQATGSVNGFLASADWTNFSYGLVLSAYNLLGSTYKSASLTVFNPAMITTTSALADGSARFCAVIVPISATITGVKWFQGATGNYTADNYNGVGLYSYSGGTMTLVASSTNDGNIWKGTLSTWQTKAFSSTYVASAGVYFICALYNSSAETTPPSIGSSTAMSNANVSTQDFTNSAKLVSLLNSQASLPSSQAMSGTTASNFNYGFWLY